MIEEKTLEIKRFERYNSNTREYELAIITDEDQGTQIKLEDGQIAWRATLRYNAMYREMNPQTGKPSYKFQIPGDKNSRVYPLISLISEGGRGAEFSELIMFGDRLLTMDDRTGLVCEIRKNQNLVPRQILITGSGDEKFKGYKSEWATLKGDHLYVGSHGRVDLDNGKVSSGELEWVKIMDPEYRIYSEDWHDNYEKMRNALGIDSSVGYLTHEAAEWHPFHKKWYFFPRKVSYESFDEQRDAREKGTNIMLVADENFENIETIKIGDAYPERGVSSIKFVPGHPEECIGLKSVELDGETATYIFAFDIHGNMLSDEIYYGSYKCEGVEFV